MMSLAKMVGIDVPAIDLVDIASINNLPAGINQLGSKAFIVKRFDRTGDGQRIHTEDFAQVFGVYPHAKYEKTSYRSLARVSAAESGDEDIAEFIRRATFKVLIGNGDMHLRNWSLIYRDRQRAELSPAYDLASTIAYNPDDKSALGQQKNLPMDQNVRSAIGKHLATLAITAVGIDARQQCRTRHAGNTV